MSTVEAQYSTRCPADCGQPVEPGDPIVYSETYDGWVHEDCDPDAADDGEGW